MNATQVEIQRIQTRLQELGRTRRKSDIPEDSHPGDIEERREREYPSVDLPAVSPRQRPTTGFAPAGPSTSEPDRISAQAYTQTKSFVERPPSPSPSSAAQSGFSPRTTEASRPAALNRQAMEVMDLSTELLEPPSERAAFREAQVQAPQVQAPYMPAQRARVTSSLGSTAARIEAIPPEAAEVVSDAVTSSVDLYLGSRQVASQFIPPHQSLTSLHYAVEELDRQAQRVNALASNLESALRDMGAIAQRVNHQRVIAAAAGQTHPLTQLEGFSVCDYRFAAVPKIERTAAGAFVVTAHHLEGLNPVQVQEKQAGDVAEQLRQQTLRHSRQGVQSPLDVIGQLLQSFVKGSPASVHKTRQVSAQPGGVSAQSRSVRQEGSSSFSVRGALLWVAGAAVVRIGLDLLLISFPALWPPVIALVVTPAAIAIYRTTVDPQSSLSLGRRLLLIMIGLLLGGRL